MFAAVRDASVVPVPRPHLTLVVAANGAWTSFLQFVKCLAEMIGLRHLRTIVVEA